MTPFLPAFSEPTDAELVAQVRGGDGEAFTPLVRRHLASVRAFVAMKLPVAHLADEISHEAFVFAFQNLGELESADSFRAWLRAIAWNLVRKELLRFAREHANLSKLEQNQLADLSADHHSSIASDETVFLEECLATLPDKSRNLVKDRYQRGLSNDELAAAMGRTSEWVRVTLFRIRAQLRECITMKLDQAMHEN
jgi:RNA polymerase sigma-70 factor, ECF subfamily